MEGYPEEYGSLLDIAFQDRLEMYEAQKLRNVDPMCQTDQRGTIWAESYFYDDDGRPWVEPGWAERKEDGDHDEADIRDEDTCEAGDRYCYNYHGGGVGPDGRGKDKLIKNGRDLESCIVEIVAQLTSLESLCWKSPVLPMPVAIGEVLQAARHLTGLHVSLYLPRQGCHAGEF